MTGHEHYLKAEELLEIATKASADKQVVAAQQLTSWAQVHATLALAAATQLNNIVGPDFGPDFPQGVVADSMVLYR